jgi:hypothetical protein
MKRRNDTTATPPREPDQMTVERDGAAEPRLPHERDQSADSQQPASTHREVGRKAFDDVTAGRVDTDRGPVLEELSRTHFQRRAPAGTRKGKR